MGALEIDLVLAPVDGSGESETAAEYAVTIAERYDATIHLVYVLEAEQMQAIDGGEAAADQLADEIKSFTDHVTAHGADHGVTVSSSTAYGYSTRIKTRHPGSVILDTADEIRADFLVIPRQETTENGTGGIFEKVAEYIVLYASQPVLSV